jgi:hypothetical protein
MLSLEFKALTRGRREFADIAIHGDQSAPLQFTFSWTGSNGWEGHNYEVGINQRHTSAVAA